MTRLKSLTKKQLRAIIAVVVALCVLVPSALIGLHVRAEQQAQKQSDEMYTSKEVTYDETTGTYHVRIDAYATSASLATIPTDNVLVLERSERMSEVLYSRDHTNLKTNTSFTAFSSMPTHNDLYEGNENPDNTSGISFAVSHLHNKYIKDPNNPDLYVYLCQTYNRSYEKRHDNLLKHYYNDYSYQIIDSKGNVYETEIYDQWLGTSIGSTILPFNISSLDFHWVSGPNGSTAEENGVTDSFSLDEASDFYERDDDYSLNTDLYDTYQAYGLYIKDDTGTLCPVTMTPVYNSDNGRLISYKYEVTTSEGKTLTAYYGNPVFGTDYSVFQGFKSYVTDSDGDLVYDVNEMPIVDHENSLDHRTLYSGEGENVTRLLAMQEAAEDFIITLHRKAFDNNQIGVQKVGIVSYASRTEPLHRDYETTADYQLTDVYYDSNIYPMIQTIYALEANGRRRLDDGLEVAKEEVLDTGSDASHNVNVIAFTAGVVSDKVDGEFKVDYANTALVNAAAIESAYPKTKVYTIGMFDLADEEQLHGNWFYRTTHANIACDGSVGSYWGGTATSGWANDEMDEKDTAAMNRFLNYLSSNYAGATDLGVTRGYIHPGGWSLGGTGYTIYNNLDPTAEGYYYAAGDAEENEGASLNEAFQAIAESVVIPNGDLNEDTSLYDSVTAQFTNISNVQAYTSTYNGSGSLEDNSNWTDNTSDTLETTVTDDSVSATGFNYGENYATEGGTGKKAILEFDVELIDGFLGGHDIYTNGEDSGFYSADDVLVESFTRPTVDIDPDPSVTVHDQKIYRATHADLRDSFDRITTDGVINEYVDVQYIVKDSSGNQVFTYTIPAGDTTGYYDLSGEAVAAFYATGLADTTDYTVECVMTTVSDEVDFTASDTSTIYVYNPTVTVDDDKYNYATAVAGVDLTPTVTWTASVSEGESVPEGLPEGDAPTVTFTIQDLTESTTVPTAEIDSYSLDETRNFQVTDVVVSGETWTYTADRTYYQTTDGDWILGSVYEADPDSYSLATETYTDDDGNEYTLPVTKTVEDETVTVTNDDEANSTGNFTTFVTLDLEDGVDSTRTNGEFTVYVTKYFTLNVQKLFAGDYANPEEVTINVTDPEGNVVKTHTFAASDFTSLRSPITELGTDLYVGTEYTISETLENPDFYSASYAATNKADATVSDLDQSDTTYTFSTDTEDDEITVVVTNTWKSEHDPVVTGISDKDGFNRTLLIAIAATAALSAGGYGIYRINRAKKETE